MRGWAVCATLLLLTLAGCGAGTSVEKADNGALVLVAGESTVEPTGQVSGTILMVGDCVGLQIEGADDPALVVWVHGTTVTMGDVPVLVMPSGQKLEVGGSFTGGGDTYDRDDLPDFFPDLPKGCPGSTLIYAYPMTAASVPPATPRLRPQWRPAGVAAA